MTWRPPAPAVADLAIAVAGRRRARDVEIAFGPGLPEGAPGQFVMVDTGDGVLPTPFSVFRDRPDGGFSVLIRPGGRPAAALSARLRGSRPTVRAFGPLGRPFPPPPPGARALCAADAGHLSSLVRLVQALAQGATPVRVIAGGEGVARAPARRVLADAGVRVEAVPEVTAAVAAALSAATPADVVYVAAPVDALAHAARLAGDMAAAPAVYVAVEVAMACGVGACFGCPVALARPEDPRHPYARACTEGPVFAAQEVRFS